MRLIDLNILISAMDRSSSRHQAAKGCSVFCSNPSVQQAI